VAEPDEGGTVPFLFPCGEKVAAPDEGGITGFPFLLRKAVGGLGLLDLGKVQKEFAGGKGPSWAERAGARESLVVLSCSNP
jgi:hypothetical protein